MNYMEVKEFREFGYLQELNRKFLHPLGLALEVYVNDETGEESFGRIWDYRDDPEGMVFGPDQIDGNKAVAVRSEELRFEGVRVEMMGDAIQPLDWAPEIVAPVEETDETDPEEETPVV